MPTPHLPDLPPGSAPALLALGDVLPVGLVVLDGGRVAWTNRAAEAQFGLARGALDGRPAEELFADRDEATDVLHGPAGSERRVRLRRGGDDTFHAEVRGCPFRLGDRALRLLVVCDLSERDRMHDRLAQQHEELQAMARRLLCVQEDERRTLSRELHDDIGQQITAIKLGAMALLDDDDARRRIETVSEIVGIADQTIAKLRDLSMLLRPPQLDGLGLEAALRWQAGVLFRSGQPRLALALSPLPHRPPAEVELACFRIAQEALTNAVRHAGATVVSLRLDTDGDALALEILDDGRGFAAGSAPGLGLVTMRERAQLLGGTLEIESAPGRGCRVRAGLPLQRPPDQASASA